ncbi:type II toxin-antitoxin system PemK/MazF family toxin [Mycolicibacterium sp.]|uniref:type II toxin-antitoxin system PemK/MazF family toxin n=1 Tax=Mycolicibacterium sp. TaxID=2320850 RepID=UPI001A1E5279|nr:type II toxin-antitoxin system PemK/MazF family toxin [Mycolicibacterium sp.]MBJ7398818.1 type II toxin-antitoxin system PemK/MazF family toxin [Mycolicibacterium sp.]
MRRGEVWTASGGRHYAGKPRPVLIIQDDLFDKTASITVCPLTSDPVDVPLLRIALEPDSDNGLSAPSRIMIDTITTMPKNKLGERIGRISDTDMLALSRSMFVFLGLAVRNND